MTATQEQSGIEIRRRCDASTTAGYFDQQALRWTQKYGHDGYFRERLSTVLNWLHDLPVGLSLLDYGCGSGVLLAELARLGHTITGVDVSAGMLASARRTLEAAGVPSEHFGLEQVGEDSQGKYLEQSYDVIISLGVIEYVDRPMELLARLVDRLRPQGSMILSFPNRSSVLRKIERFIFKYPFPFRPLGIFSHLTAADSYLNFQKHQFIIQEIDQFFAGRGLLRERMQCYVAPGSLRRWSAHPLVGMTVMAEFCRPEP